MSPASGLPSNSAPPGGGVAAAPVRYAPPDLRGGAVVRASALLPHRGSAWLGLVLLLGALLAPPVFWLGRTLVHRGWLLQLAPFAFPTYLRRCWLLCALVALPWWRRHLRADWRPGGASWAQAVRQVGLGGAIGAVGVVLLAGGLVVAGYLRPRALPQPSRLAAAIVSALLTACTVAAAEEMVFRGLVWRRWCRRWGLQVGSVASATLFAAVHFVASSDGGRGRSPVVEDVAWWAGLAEIGRALLPWTQPEAIAASFCTLMALGVALSVAAARSRALWLPMGLHGGWIFGLRLLQVVAVRARPEDVWLGADLRAGLAPLLLALATTVLLLVAWPKTLRTATAQQDRTQ